MKLSELRTFARLNVSTLKGNKLDNTELDVLLKAAVRLTAQVTECLSGTTKFDAVAGQGDYSLAANVPNFVSMQKSGIWFNNGTATDTSWKRLQPVTRAWLDENLEQWRDQSPSTPQYYYWDNETIGLHPAPLSSLENGIMVYHYRQPQEMVQDSDYPFEGATSIPHLEILDDCIFEYIKWKTSPIVGKEQQENPYEAAYYREARSKRDLIKSRYDTANYTSSGRNTAKFRGKRV